MAENDKAVSTTGDNGTVSPSQKSVQGLLKDVNIQKMISERLGKNSSQIVTSALSIVNNNKLLQTVTNPMTVVQAVLTAGNLDLPLNPNLGFAYIVPYKGEAQFQMGWKGFVQLAQRSGKFETITSVIVYEGDTDETVTKRMTAIIVPDPPSDVVIGYVAYFKLLNGFQKSIYMTKAQIEKHAKRFSQSYGKGSFSPWSTDFDSMAQKTVMKQLLSKYAPLSTEMVEAVTADQSVTDENGSRYVDNDPIEGELADDDAAAAILDANTDKGTGEIKEPKK